MTPVLIATLAAAAFSRAATSEPPLVIGLVAREGQVQVRPGPGTPVLTYEALQMSGPPGALTTIPGSYLGPIVRVRKGQTLTATLANALPENTIIHWHGLNVPPEMDGHPRDEIGPGESLTYHFTVVNPAGTYFFHPHTDMLTAEQVYRGLAGVLIVEDEEEQALALPRGERDLPLVLQDRLMDQNNAFVYAPSGMAGLLGTTILVNGAPTPEQPCATRAYRLRLVNGSNARIFKLAWGDGRPMTVLAGDAGLLEAPVPVPYLVLAPGERAEVWADFRDLPVGSTLALRSLAFSGAGSSGQSTLPQGAAFDVMTFRVTRQEPETLTLPTRLVAVPRHDPGQAWNFNAPRTFALAMSMGSFTINGRVFEMNAVAPDEIVRDGVLEAWEFTNTGTMMTMAHPMHVHGPSFQVVGRTVLPSFQANYATISAGLVDGGWDDTVLVYPGERVKVLVRFGPYRGLYLYHCHNLEHEDMGMMRNFRVDP